MTASAPLIFAFGDSLVARYGLATADGFAARLERPLRHTFGRTRGRRQRRRQHYCGRLAAAASSAVAPAGRPNLAIVPLGPNDVLREVPPSSTLANLEAILVEFDRCGIPVLLTTVAPPPSLAQRAGPYTGIPKRSPCFMAR